MAGPPRAPLLYAEAGHLVQQLGLPVAPTFLADRAAFHHSAEQGKTAPEIEPSGRAAQEVSGLWAWTCKHVNMSERKRVIKREVA
jgi:chromosome partitioning protein